MSKKSGRPPQPSLTGDEHLKHSALNLRAVRDEARERVAAVLGRIGGRKLLIFDAQAASWCSMFALSEMKTSLNIAQIMKFERIAPTNENVDVEFDSLVYILQPTHDSVKRVVEHGRQLARSGDTETVGLHIVFLPRGTKRAEQQLLIGGVKGTFRVHELRLPLLPVDDDYCLVGTVGTDFVKDVIVDKDLADVYSAAEALMQIQATFGVMPVVAAKGDMSARVLTLLQRLQREQRKELSLDEIVPEITDAVILDRSVDAVTPLLTQSTYEGVIHEHFGIDLGCAEVDAELALVDTSKPSTGPTKAVVLNSSDSVFRELRGLPFSQLGKRLKQRISQVDEALEERHKRMTTREMSAFMSQFKTLVPERERLQLHINVAEYLSRNATKGLPRRRQLFFEFAMLAGFDNDACEMYVEELAGRVAPLRTTLRFFALLCLTRNGLKQKRFDSLRQMILNSYGFGVLSVLNHMRTAGLIGTRSDRLNFATLRKVFALVEDEGDLNFADVASNGRADLNTVYSGYAPLLVRLVEALHLQQDGSFVTGDCDVEGEGWRGKDVAQAMQYLPGGVRILRQSDKRVTKEEAPVTLVMVLGGVTHSELAALRLLQQRSGRRYVVLSAGDTLSSQSLLRQLVPRRDSASRTG
ncbi:MAG: hypothetical protein MHM6MM_006239 [Cercozoa sp. M6MM]